MTVGRPRDRSLWTAALAYVGVDSAVAYGLFTRIWQAAAGVVSLLLISRYFSPDIQGYYYTFFSLLALQTFVELGLYLVIINTASHEWAHLKLSASGGIEGDTYHRSRLASLARFIFAWYTGAAVLFLFGVGAGGAWFFSQQSGQENVNWVMPWIAMVAAFSVTMVTSPFLTLLEGCNQVLEVNRTRLVQAVTGAVLLWLAILLGAELWACLVTHIVNLGFSFHLLFGTYRRFILPLLRSRPTSAIDWRREIWPMQWRLALQGLTNYFSNSLYNPVMFHFWGAAVAGRMGMTLQVVYSLQLIGQAWLQAKIPQFGVHIARRDYQEIDRAWRATTIRSVGVVVLGGVAIWMLAFLLEKSDSAFSQRILEPALVALLALSAVFSQLIQCVAAYVRAHKKEPFLIVGMCSGALGGALIWWWGSTIGPAGAVWGTLAVTVLFSMPFVLLIWRHGRYREDSA